MIGLRSLLLAALAATATGLRLTPAVSRAQTDRAQRTATIFAQQQAQLPPGWTAHQDESGQFYYCSDASGQCQWDFPGQEYQQYGEQQDQYSYALSSGADEETVTYISQQLQEPQSRIPRAVVEFLGSAVALDLLDQTAQVQAAGGMLVPDTGKPRTAGGVYLQLLKTATNLPRDAQDAAIERIRTTGKNVKSWEKAFVELDGVVMPAVEMGVEW